jgi:WD40 repeat protein
VETIWRQLPVTLFILLLTSCTYERPTLLTAEPVALTTPVYSKARLGIDSVEDVTELAIFQAHGAGPVVALAFTPDGQQLLAVSAGDGMLRRWQLSDGDLKASWEVSTVAAPLVNFDSNAHLLATSSGKEPEVRLWNTETGKLLFELSMYTEPLSVLALSPVGNWLFGGLPGGFVFVDTETGRAPDGGSLRFDSQASVPTAAVFDPAGEWVVTGYASGRICASVWDEDRGLFDLCKFKWSYKQPKDSLSKVPLALAIDPIRRWLASIVGDTLQVWDLASYPLPSRKTYEGIGISQVGSLAFSPDGKLLVVGTGEGWQIWSVPEFNRISQESSSAVYAVTFSPDGRILAWGDENGKVHIWGVQE